MIESRQENIRHIIKTNTDVYTNVHFDDKRVEIEIRVFLNDGEGSFESWDFDFPLEVVRKLSLELAEDIKNHDEKIAKKNSQ